MHQQIRTKLGQSTGSDGPGAMAQTAVEGDPVTLRQGALIDLLDLLAGAGFNLKFAGGANIEAGGDVVFAVDDERTADCAAFLRDHEYRDVRIVEPYHCEVEDRPGALAECLRDLVAGGRKVNEIFVGTPEKHHIPIQVTTVKHVS